MTVDVITAARVQALKERVISLQGKRTGYGSDVLSHRVSASSDPAEVPGLPVDSTVREIKNFLLDFHDFDNDNTIRSDSYFPEDLDHLDARISTLERGNESSHGCRGACTGLCTGTCSTVCSGCSGTETTSTVTKPVALSDLTVPVAGMSGWAVAGEPDAESDVSLPDDASGWEVAADDRDSQDVGAFISDVGIPLPMEDPATFSPVRIPTHEMGIVYYTPFTISSTLGDDIDEDNPYAIAPIATCTGACVGTCSGTCTPSLNGGSCSNMCTSCTRTCASDCAGGCKNTCTGCSGGCNTTCTATCANDCTGGCKGGCNTTCTGGCKTGCNTTCSGSCRGGCRTGCYSGCYTTCTATCANDCTNTCTGTCKQGCQTGCQASCSESCSSTCSATCYRDCAGTCYGMASAPVSR